MQKVLTVCHFNATMYTPFTAIKRYRKYRSMFFSQSAIIKITFTEVESIARAALYLYSECGADAHRRMVPTRFAQAKSIHLCVINS